MVLGGGIVSMLLHTDGRNLASLYFEQGFRYIIRKEPCGSYYNSIRTPMNSRIPHTVRQPYHTFVPEPIIPGVKTLQKASLRT